MHHCIRNPLKFHWSLFGYQDRDMGLHWIDLECILFPQPLFLLQPVLGILLLLHHLGLKPATANLGFKYLSCEGKLVQPVLPDMWVSQSYGVQDGVTSKTAWDQFEPCCSCTSYFYSGAQILEMEDQMTPSSPSSDREYMEGRGAALPSLGGLMQARMRSHAGLGLRLDRHPENEKSTVNDHL